ncbi:partial Metalloprotease PmbA, partial [Rhodocyclaceae bacterium]
NLHMEPGAVSPEALIAEIGEGFYITDLIGMGVNGVTGDYSRGAAGFWIESGELAFPVSEVTISLNLDEILKRIDAIADDLDLRTSIATPTFRVSAMILAGR